MIHTLRRLLFLAILIAIHFCHIESASAATRTTLNGQVFGLANQIKRCLKENPLVEGQSLQLEEFQGPGGSVTTNFGHRIEQLLRAELSDSLSETSRLRLKGNYHFVESEEPMLKDIKILLITAKIVDDRDRELVSLAIEVNDTDNVMQVLGLTGAAPQDTAATFQQRNQSIQVAYTKPTFKIVGQNRVAAEAQPTFSVGLFTKASATGTATPVTPLNVSGLAYVPVNIGQYYEIAISNADSIDVVASITIDGLDVANTFSVDSDSKGNRIKWPGYLIPAGKDVVIRGWLHSINQQSRDNLFSFKVDELGKGAATALKARGSVGVVTVQFREACEPNSRLSKRSIGETARGESLQEKLTARPVQIGENVLSTVSLRYNRPATAH